MNTENTENTENTIYRDGTWIHSANGKVRACFEFIGEGYEGDYDETDPTDAALYRLDVNVAAEYTDATHAEPTDDPNWVYPADGSICTVVRMDDTDDAAARLLLAYAAASIADAVTSGTTSVKRTMDMLSYLPTLR